MRCYNKAKHPRKNCRMRQKMKLFTFNEREGVALPMDEV